MYQSLVDNEMIFISNFRGCVLLCWSYFGICHSEVVIELAEVHEPCCHRQGICFLGTPETYGVVFPARPVSTLRMLKRVQYMLNDKTECVVILC